MRVVLVHNYYRSDQPSGENASVDLQIAGLRGAGVTVEVFAATSDSIGNGIKAGARVARSCLGSRDVRREFTDLLDSFQPHVVHLENLFPLISPLPAVLAKTRSIPVVASVRNYRLTCAAGTHLRNGEACTLCPDQSVSRNLPAVMHGCYRDSRVASVPIVVGMDRYAQVMRDLDLYLPNSDFMATYLTSVCGIPTERVVVRPNAGTQAAANVRPIQTNSLLYAGRFVPEKGVLELVEAWERTRAADSGWSLNLAGSGPLEPRLRERVAGIPSIAMLGQLGPSELAAALDDAALVVVPSQWDEPFGRAAIDAFARGRGVLVTDRGGLGSLVAPGTGLLMQPAVEGIMHGLERVFAMTRGELGAMGVAAAKHYNDRFTPERNLKTLLASYEAVIT